MTVFRAFGTGILLLLLLPAGCSGGEEGGQECTDSAQCGPGRTCVGGTCRGSTDDADSGLRRDLPSTDLDDPGPSDAPPDSSPADLDDLDCGEACVEPDCAEDMDCGSPVQDTSGDSADGVAEVDDADPLADLIPQCAEFCRALCEFLEECGKNDPTCLARCGQSPRYQQLSSAACTEGAHVIGLEDCRLWLDCGGRSCAIDEMCLEVIPSISYQCAPLCDHTQSQPACPSGVDCSTVMDAAGNIMSSLGMCWSLF